MKFSGDSWSFNTLYWSLVISGCRYACRISEVLQASCCSIDCSFYLVYGISAHAFIGSIATSTTSILKEIERNPKN
jgi:hypothetical protein